MADTGEVKQRSLLEDDLLNSSGVISRPTRPSFAGRLKQLQQLGGSYGTLAALLLLVLFNLFFTRNFVSFQTLNINLTQVSTIAIVAVGMTLVIATGGIDLSVGSLMAIAGALAPLILQSTLWPFSDAMLGVILAYILPISAVALLGVFVNGGLITFFKTQPIIATLILYIAGRGIAQVMTNGNLNNFQNSSFQFIGLGKIFDIPFQILLMLAIVIFFEWVIRKTVFGRYILAVGGNETAARLAGVPVSRIKLIVYGISGFLAGIAGLIIISLNSSSDANQVGLNMELDAIAAVAVGGTALSGGRATLIGTLLGALIIQLIRYTLLSHGVAESVSMVIKAVIIIVAVYIQRQQQG